MYLFYLGLTIYIVDRPLIVEVEMPEMIVVSEPIPAKTPLQIATWSPTKYDGRFTAMTAGYLTVINNCLALTRDRTLFCRFIVKNNRLE